AAVDLTEPMGSDLMAWTQLGGVRVSIRLPAEAPVSLGDRLRLSIPAGRLNLFDAGSGQRL
ncbi:MAG TPA: hypothetical protein VGC80_10305, partial [Acetobacteraceae bacterium]